MSEKWRALNSTSGNVHGQTHKTVKTTAAAKTSSKSKLQNMASNHNNSGSSSHTVPHIGAPTLISTTLQQLPPPAPTPTPTPTTPTPQSMAGGDGNTSSNSHSPNTAMLASGAAGSDTESNSTDYNAGAIGGAGAGGALGAGVQLNFHLLDAGTAGDGNSIMNSSQISGNSNESMQLSSSPAAVGGGGGPVASIVGKSGGGKHLTAHSVAGKSCRFPKLEECAHFHYERVQLGAFSVRLMDDKSELLNSSIASQSIGGDIAGSQLGQALSNSGTGPSSYRSFSPANCWFIIKVFPHSCDPFLVKRSFDNMQMLDEMLHRCVYDRKISGLKNLEELDFKSEEDVEYAVAKYLERFSKIASDSLTCGTILTWLQLDNKGRRLPLADGDTMRTINTPAVGAAYGVRRYQAQASDEISIEVGDMISVIDMPSPAESIWWRGKKSHLQKSQYEVGFFPQSCVATIGDKVPRHFPMPAPLVGQLDVSPTKPVLRKHGKLIAFFRSFILSRPSRRRLKQSGIYRERVFSCDLSEHLLNSGQEIPMVLKCCAEFIEEYGIVDGIYRLSGITSNIQKLRRAFDEERIPDLGNPEMKQDIHAVSSLLKMYFRELPNPLCTYQLYDNFVEAIQEKSESNERLRLMKETVLKLPPPHYRTLKYLAEHLNRISQHSARTSMNDKNLAIVWAPNLLRSPALESGGVAALRGVGVQAVVTEYLIRNCHNIFDAFDDMNVRLSYIATAGAAQANETRLDSLTDCESLLVEQREHDQSLTYMERPKSLSTGGPKLISLEEAQERHSRIDGLDMKTTMPINMVSSNAANIGSYIEVGGGPSSLPDKYHTVLSVPRSWQKRKTHSWKSLFTRNQRPISNGAHDLKTGAASTAVASNVVPPARQKDGSHTQVTFAEADLIITNAGKVGKALHKQEKPKSIELFETSSRRDDVVGKPMEVCVRSNSIDSLRTAGHSRSVSHDSYFDLLQSPQRGHVTTCPSRELSELGLNFDREEPEMRIFSESESLVSSPRVGKENIPPSSGAASRRILRARPEEFSSQTNSVNPSPKKQPRLNLHLSPSAASALANNWAQQGGHGSAAVMPSGTLLDAAGNESVCHEHHAHLSSDESCCKRYKLEDQLSDIQFIDCSTPEHTIANPQTLYASVQVHAPPKSALSKNSLYGSTESTNKSQDAVSAKAIQFEKKYGIAAKGGGEKKTSAGAAAAAAAGGSIISTRYSYPTVQLGAKRKDQDSFKERFSYPGSGVSNERRFSAKDAASRMQFEDELCAKRELESITQVPYGRNTNYNNHTHAPKNLPDLMRPKNRNSYCNANEALNTLLLRNSTNEITKDAKSEMERSKISVTPSSPMQSPRYSLLVGETSSENSSAVNTPQYDLEPLMATSAMSGLSQLSGASSHQQQQPLLLGVDTGSCLGTSHESLGSNFTSHSNITNASHPERRDMHALKRELSLDLQPLTTKMTIDGVDGVGNGGAGHASTLPYNRQRELAQQLIPSPNNSNFTDNTSQSVTPSEFGYQNLQRQSSMHSLIETEAESPAYEEYENTPSNMASPLLGAQKPPPLGGPTSPIRATISITYNMRSPREELPTKGYAVMRDKTKAAAKGPLLETSFDENTVYEQVRFFRNSVTEVNQLLNDERKSAVALECLKETNENDMQDFSAYENVPLLNEKTTSKACRPDVPMCGEKNLLDSLEDDAEQEDEGLLYENVELRKPKSVYENLLGEQLKGEVREADPSDKLELDSLDSIKTDTDIVKAECVELANVNAQELELEPPLSAGIVENSARKSPSNFSVKELATKFESSPVEQLPAFDFSFRSSIKKHTGVVNAELKTSQTSLSSNTEQTVTTKETVNPKQKLTKSQQITRSLDENAFVREFGSKHLQELNTRSTQQLPELAEVTNRRKSFDFTRPKTLNPPKRLPGIPITEEICLSKNEKAASPAAFKHEKSYNHAVVDAALENDYETAELKITPTTENRISLIQNNVNSTAQQAAATGNSTAAAINASASDLSNSNLNLSTSSLKVLSGVKLDRERIDKIKEERRQQLTQKYRGDTTNFKSRSKTDLHTPSHKDDDKFNGAESLRVKSKSRGDMRALQQENENVKELLGRARLLAGSESTLHAPRVRSISDEKNQNCDGNTITTATVVASKNSNTNANATNNSTTNDITANTTSSLGNVNYAKKTSAAQEEFSARATVQKFERKSFEYANGIAAPIASTTAARERNSRSEGTSGGTSNSSSGIGSHAALSTSRQSLTSTREKISPQFSIRDMTAMFESRSQNS
ncbi:GTPase-activating protein CdGAPr isoform X1 [Bactrocera neohumeralis]|uniref:GTPase-activating protein CdGAPr isoform X1 n=1 Tax=Bactrocera neohumeralis TaxID=98809 RepID=UPI002165702C|nr:GTPase-activating protein CdGAPr isoform X1 [Bactrocera neohumeralis]XP_050320705.1 GTPase-activating protein CdGAPr isoform X1 [Bactrocera neohumeralis]XP_050320706.1 GTPase-activating protein CdGAPr isoform X1 [Bactrocera neohumeralis]XP_050320707.1 GTPase-activating protein CdGAPr isoform X1 [Bactrocera neohumeralis]XP_050320708.1 GTPase-activating protein CdGAPr isoform X1 [Bactrocera neohumeralis]